MSKKYGIQNKTPIIIDYSQYTYKEIDDLKKELITKNAMINQLEKIIYKLYTGREDLSTGDLHNIVRIVEGYNGK